MAEYGKYEAYSILYFSDYFGWYELDIFPFMQNA